MHWSPTFLCVNTGSSLPTNRYLMGDIKPHFFSGREDSVSSLAFSLDGKLVASGGFDGLIQVWDISSGSLKCTLEGPGGGIEVII